MTQPNPLEGLPSFTVSVPENWQKWVEGNTDPYGRGVITYAAQWAHLMEAEFARRELIASGPVGTWTEQERTDWQNGVIKAITETAEHLSHEADTEGITGFMYGAAVQVLTDSWVYGEWLRRWHNKEYGREDAEGVVNPALITISGGGEDQ